METSSLRKMSENFKRMQTSEGNKVHFKGGIESTPGEFILTNGFLTANKIACYNEILLCDIHQ